MPKGGEIDSGRKLSGRDKTTLTFSQRDSGMVSYEDLLIAQYLEEMKKSRIEVKKDRDLPASPYLQRLPHSNTTTVSIKYHKRRPASATARIAVKDQHDKPKIDAKFIADPTMWDPETPRSEKPGHRRPASAPIKRLNRPVSGASSRYSCRVYLCRPGSAKRPRNLYRRQPHTIRVVAYKNGSREGFVKATAPNVKMLLECLTTRLGLPFAARKLFLEDGIEVFDGQDIPPDAEVYVSMGENYKNPHIPTKRNLILREGAVWTLSGVILPEEGKKKKTKSRLSKRMMTLIDRKKVRIVVYRNGKSKEPVEIVADLANMEEFLVACTAKLDLRSHARILYDWEGNEIADLSATPILDDCLQNGPPVMGPLWVSVGEGFSPTGTAHFITSITQVLKAKLKEVKRFKTEINYAMDEDDKDKVTIPSILSLQPDELYNALEQADADIEQLSDTLKRLKSKQEALRSEQEREESMGASYKMTHIQELSAEDRLVGTKGLKLKVYENGTGEGSVTFYFNMREALKGIGNDQQKLMARLLDELSTSRWSSGGVNPKLNAVAQKLYDKYGREITNVLKLEPEQEIWVSYGEAFICPFAYCIEAFFDKATKLELEGETRIVREQLMAEDTEATDEHTQWEATIGFPVMYESATNHLMDPDKVKWMTECAEVDQRAYYLLHKKRQDLALYPELICNEKFRLRADDKRPAERALRRMKEVQTWVITQSGYILCKFMPQLCLGVSDTTTKGRFFDHDSEMEGLVVTLQKKMAQNPNQMWRFTSDATIASVAYPDKVLTYLGNKFGDEESYTENLPDGVKSGARVYLILSEPKPKKEGACQRFALKQERFENLGQWKYTQTTNSEWHKLAYSWPITVSGDLNEKYDWPMEGYLIPHAPPLHKSDKKSALSGMAPIKLYVMRNGDRDTSFAISVVGPNLTTMMKDNTKKDKKEGGHRHRKQDAVASHADSVDVDVNLHCRDLTVRELEFIMFLDHCTSLLDLPFAARRLFDVSGTEHFTLQSLKRDQLVYVTCGEQWSDPSLTKTEQQRRYLLSQLSTDVAKIRQFVSLRDPQNLVMEVDGGLTPNTNIVINTCWSPEEEEAESRARETNLMTPRDMGQQEEDNFENLSPHERAHMRSEKRLDNLRWPWERLVNVGNSSEDDDPEANKYSNKDMYDKYKPKPSPRVSRGTLQRFVYEDGFIACSVNRGLVMGVQEQEGRVIEVFLQKRRPDDINQRWVMKENGEIRSKLNQRLSLTVATPNIQSDDTRPLSYSRCQVTLQGRRLNQYGKAHQRWRYDAETGFIHAFYADQHDKEITAANKADVCTYAVSNNAEIDQPGYLVELTDRKNRDVRVCLSCARAMRGRHKLQRLPNNKPFACAMGQAKKLKLRQVGSFCVLNGKVDLSTHEAEISLQNWEESLETLREETSIKTIAKQINAAKTVKTVKLLVYKNGEGRMRSGVKVYGSSIQGILNQCTQQLGLNQAATRLYTEDGVMILDMDDLIDWAVENYKTVMADRIERMIMLNGDGDNVPEGGDNSAEVLHGHASQETHSQLAKAMQNMERFDEDERGGGDADDQRAGDGGEDEGGETSQGENKEEKTELDSQETNKVAKQRELLFKSVPLPPLETILRYPIELWVSSGKSFVSPEVVESKDINRRKKRAFRAQVSLDLDIEKHVLRQMKGRRMDELNPGEYRSTLSSTQPVVIEGNWQKLTVQEQIKHDNVHKLQTHLGEIKANQNLDLANVNLKGRLYQQPNMKRVLVYPNGESLERAVNIWGETLDQLMEAATTKLSLWKKARFFFTSEGKLIETFEDIEKDQLLCVSMGKTFKKAKIQTLDVEVKANWGRARRQYGPAATDLTVSAKGNVKVDVDPFGPPELALPLDAPK